MNVQFSANGQANIPEFGTVKYSVECKVLYEMDGMQQVVAGTKYQLLFVLADGMTHA